MSLSVYICKCTEKGSYKHLVGKTGHVLLILAASVLLAF